ncbi:hypothetical protein [uncultured Thermomonospora sp.]|jgi:hypothetical protein|uniref:hypothetical protein n=1 Tax=uncultured Thermomonospora sp. TaxID=671175 RepID=UPI00259B448F|nr:hypothetical protein [uncultured Thermomonospora sp.]
MADAIATTSSRRNAVSAELERARYQRIVQRLPRLAEELSTLAEQIRQGAAFVAGCAEATRHRAEQMAALRVDTDTVGRHYEAATAMEQARSLVDRLAATIAEIATAANHTAAAHRGQYGGVAEAARSMAVEQADPRFYANR